MENFDIKKFLVENKLTTNSRILSEVATHFFRVHYTAPKNWYGDAREVINATLHFAPDNIVSRYEISYEDTDSKNENYLIKLYSNVDRQTLQKHLDGHSTSVEKYVVL